MRFKQFLSTLCFCAALSLPIVQCEGDVDRGDDQINYGINGYADIDNTIRSLRLTSCDNSGNLPVPIVGNRCPRRAYMLQIMPELTIPGHSYNRITPNITDAHIFTLTDFSADYPANSCVDALFYRVNSMYTGIGTPIRYVDAGEYYTLVLMNYPPAGNYQFRVEFTSGEGAVVSADTDMLAFFD
ncbi:MAG: DUF5034 domain-containing protein [Prevotellaceae bacterium]|jgi:hypothetical protein|nr:DUF5034 domain-containing protein [Prevotellaceae bacterium]